MAERGAVNDVSKQSQLPGNPLYHWPISRAEGVGVVSGTTDMYPTTRVPLSADHRGLTIVSVSGGD